MAGGTRLLLSTGRWSNQKFSLGVTGCGCIRSDSSCYPLKVSLKAKAEYCRRRDEMSTRSQTAVTAFVTINIVIDVAVVKQRRKHGKLSGLEKKFTRFFGICKKCSLRSKLDFCVFLTAYQALKIYGEWRYSFRRL